MLNFFLILYISFIIPFYIANHKNFDKKLVNKLDLLMIILLIIIVILIYNYFNFYIIFGIVCSIIIFFILIYKYGHQAFENEKFRLCIFKYIL
ncbi:hypothetical protein YN1_7970 [Nanoarchaeota archaeon]